METRRTPAPCSKAVRNQSTGRNHHDAPLSRRSNGHTRVVSTGSVANQIPSLNDIHSHAAYRQQLLNEFLCCYIPIANQAVQQRLKEDVPWLLMLPQMSSMTKALELAILAVSTAKLGRVNDDPVMVNQSKRLYVIGLRELQRALWDPKLMFKDETLAACASLSVYEVLECPTESGKGWLSHQNGCARLIELRGADAHRFGISHELFRVFRISEVHFSELLRLY